MTSVLDETTILDEIVVSLRNADIFTTTQRGVTTKTDTDTFVSPTSSLLINRTNIKNVRSVKIATVPLVFGKDYTVDYDYLSTTIQTKITFTTAQTGAWEVIYDYGTDKIFSGYPRNDLTISSFPRIAVEFVDINTEIGGFGNVNQNRYDLTIMVYDIGKESTRAYSKVIRTWIINNQNSLYYAKVIKPTITGPLVPGPFELLKNQVFQRNIDFRSILNLEVN